MTLGTGIAVAGAIWAFSFLVAFSTALLIDGRDAFGRFGIATAATIASIFTMLTLIVCWD